MRGILIYDILQGKAKGCFAISDCQYPVRLFVSATEYCKGLSSIISSWPVNNRQTQKPLSIVCEIFKCPRYAASARQDRQIKSQSWSRISMEREYEVVPESETTILMLGKRSRSEKFHCLILTVSTLCWLLDNWKIYHSCFTNVLPWEAGALSNERFYIKPCGHV